MFDYYPIERDCLKKKSSFIIYCLLFTYQYLCLQYSAFTEM